MEEEDLYYRKYYKNKNNKLPQWNNIYIFRIARCRRDEEEEGYKEEKEKKKGNKEATIFFIAHTDGDTLLSWY